MPRVTEETLVDVRLSVTKETRQRPNPDPAGDPIDVEFDVISFADRNGPDIRIVRVPLDENGKAALLEALTGGVVVPKLVLPS